MLNQDTKRRIDTARDILVGKVPDPKVQVEQITTALIYKFMDDMDKKSEELGGEASFFVNDYAKYGWSNLLDSRLSGIERLNLYIEALLKMPQNLHLPRLFRDILKGAFLPYRDPETLNLFLKEINGFTYDPSEELGDAFEYLLSILGSQGDAGQFQTPRHIIDFIVEVIGPRKTEIILDPACGTAGFLISGYKHILKQNSYGNFEDRLTPDEKTKLMNHFIGYDISPDMVRLSLTNMYLHGFSNPNIFEYDSLTNEEHWDETYDVIMANPPFMSPKGGILPHKRFSIPTNRSEILFVDYIAEHLNSHGRAGVIVPEGIIFQSGSVYKALRKKLVEKYLYAVISLPAGVFQPYSGVKTSILFMDKQLAKRADSILFIKVENDGYDLGAQRRPINKNDLPQALAILQRYNQSLQSNTDPNTILSRPEISKIAVIAQKEQIIKKGDYNLSGERYKEILVNSHHDWASVELSNEEYFQIEAGGTPDIQNPEYWNGGINWVTLADLPAENLVTQITDTNRKITDKGLINSSAKLIPPNTILVSSRATIGRIAVSKVELATNQGFKNIILKDLSKLDPMFVAYMMTNLVEQMKRLASSGTFKEISKTSFSTLKIPLPPLHIQQEIVTELDSYQKIIDGGKQVMDNYKPFIKIDQHWPTVELDDVAAISTGATPSTQQADYYTGTHPLIKTTEINNQVIKEASTFINDKALKDYNLKILPKGTLLMTMYGQGKTRGRVALLDIPAAITQNAAAIQTNEKADARYLYYYLLGYFRTLNIQGHISRLNLSFVKKLKFPLPPLDIQEQIVSKLEYEQKLLDTNKELITIFEQKVRDRIAEVWGESEF